MGYPKNIVSNKKEVSIRIQSVKRMSMIWKCHDHRLQTKLWHHEEDTHNTNKLPHTTAKTLLSKTTSSVFLSEMNANVERTQSNMSVSRKEIHQSQLDN